MLKRLFLLDGMALVYRAHFALIAKPIFTSKGVNTSALYGFTQTLLEILRNQQPTHIAVAFDTDAPTQRHAEFPEYKATRQAMPEDIVSALPHVRRILDAFNIPVLTCDGYEADDIIATVVRRAEKEGFNCYMVTQDKDFGQLVNDNVFLYKPSRMGDAVEIMGLPEIQKRWGISRAEQVVDVLALMGDSSDNIPGVPSIGEKTAVKLVAQFESVENLLGRTGELTGRTKETLEKNRETALLSKRLATLNCQVPCVIDLEALKLRPPREQDLKDLLVEFEFNSIGRRLFGEEFKAGRGFQGRSTGLTGSAQKPEEQDMPLLLVSDPPPASPASPQRVDRLLTLADVSPRYEIAASPADVHKLVQDLLTQKACGLALVTNHPDPKQGTLLGMAFSTSKHTATYVPLSPENRQTLLEQFRPLLESGEIQKTGHSLKFELSVLRWHGLKVAGKLFDTLIAHSLIEPDMRHSLGYVSEAYLGYTPIKLAEDPPLAELAGLPVEMLARYANERADLSGQLRTVLEPLLREKGQERVFYEIESPLMSVLVDMEYEGIKVDAAVLADFSQQLSRQIRELESAICQLAGTNFNLNSPRQLGQILFEVMKICAAPKKTRTGQYATDEQTLQALAGEHEIVKKLLEHRAATKLKSTYADTLPGAIWSKTGRVHTTYNQVATATGRLNSQDPNLQNIPIRTERGQEIRKAFVPRTADYRLLSADYSQIELRIIAALSREAGLLEAFKTSADVHTATAARVFGVFPDLVTPEMRRKAKMVNYGIAYGISAFGLAQRLGIPRKEAAGIIDEYFKQFSGIRQYMERTIELARERGYVETVTGRRRYIRDIRSSNASLRAAAERNAINAPVQGSAADMIKLAMIRIHHALQGSGFRSRMLLQVHDELVFDLWSAEEEQVRSLVENCMRDALPLEVPIVVEIGVGGNWLEAH